MDPLPIFYLLLTLLAAVFLLIPLLRKRISGRGREPVTNGLLALAAVLFVLALAEGWFLFCFDSTDGAMALLSSRRWMKHHVRLNSLGYRDSGSDTEASPQVARLLALGDSITFGHGIRREENRYPELLTARLRGTGVEARAMNVSWPGWDTRHEHDALQEYLDGNGAKPDVVILGYTLNDHEYYVSHRELIDAFRRFNEPPPLLMPLLERSFVASYLRNLWVRATHPSLDRMDSLLAESYRDPFVWRMHADDMSRLSAVCRQRDIPLVVVIFPFLTGSWSDYQFGEIHRTLNSFWRSQGCTVVDLLEVFADRDVSRLVVGALDTHPNERAHALAAESLLPVVRHLLEADRRVAPGG